MMGRVGMGREAPDEDQTADAHGCVIRAAGGQIDSTPVIRSRNSGPASVRGRASCPETYGSSSWWAHFVYGVGNLLVRLSGGAPHPLRCHRLTNAGIRPVRTPHPPHPTSRTTLTLRTALVAMAVTVALAALRWRGMRMAGQTVKRNPVTPAPALNAVNGLHKQCRERERASKGSKIARKRAEFSGVAAPCEGRRERIA
jgi:hypothetical protein